MLQFLCVRRRAVYLIAAIMLFDCIASIVKAHELYVDPFPFSMSMADRWYELLLQAVVQATIVFACLAYDRRHFWKIDAPQLPKEHWRDLKELRAVLYCWVAFLFLQLPIAILKDLRTLNVNSPFALHETFFSLFPMDSLFAVAIGFAAMAYDRWRIKRESREQVDRCSNCGYDLRATPDRCPECGTVPRTPIDSSRLLNRNEP
jgi:hypothetical protein